MNSRLIQLLQKTTFLVIILYFNSCGLLSQNIDSCRLVDWTVAGLENDFGSEYQLINLNQLGVDANTKDVSLRVQNIIDSIDNSGYILLLNKGTYTFHNSINLKQNMVLRGTSSQEVILEFNLGGSSASCINITASQNSKFADLISGYKKFSKQLLLGDPSGLSNSQYALIKQTNGSWDIKPINWALDAVGQLVKINKINSGTLYLKNEIRFNYSEELNPQIRSIAPIKNVGVEKLTIKRLDKANGNPTYNISFGYAVNCYVRAIESNYSQGSHIMVNSSSNIEVSGSYFHNSFCFDGKGTQGYGVTLNHYSGECLIENNIFEKLRHAMMVKAGANGNVFAYNYSIDAYRDEFPHDASGDISLHGHYAYANLFEGNVVENIIIDHYWGPSGPDNLIFRNRATSYGVLMTKSSYETSCQMFIGNEITNNAAYKGLFFITGKDHLQYGNNIRGIIRPSKDDEVSQISYYYSSSPWFFNDQFIWPAVGIPNKIEANKIPAQLRYKDKPDLTQYKQILVQINSRPESYKSENFVKKIYPNPFHDKVHIEIENTLRGKIYFNLYSLDGVLIKSYPHFNSNELIQLNIPDNLPHGGYLLCVKCDSLNEVYKIFK